MSASTSARVRKHREALRAAGLRPVQIWLPDTRAPGFAEEYRRQSRVVADANSADEGLDAFVDELVEDALTQIDREGF